MEQHHKLEKALMDQKTLVSIIAPYLSHNGKVIYTTKKK